MLEILVWKDELENNQSTQYLFFSFLLIIRQQLCYSRSTLLLKGVLKISVNTTKFTMQPSFSDEEIWTELLPELHVSENAKELDTMHWNWSNSVRLPKVCF